MIACSSSTKVLMPKAISTLNSVQFKELNLTSNDYEILNTIESTARVNVTMDAKSYTISDPDGSFSLEYAKVNETLQLQKYTGILTIGYLSNETGNLDMTPEDIVRKIAIYRIIQMTKELGGDGVIEPVITMNIEQTKSGWNSATITYLTTVSAKVVKLKSK